MTTPTTTTTLTTGFRSDRPRAGRGACSRVLVVDLTAPRASGPRAPVSLAFAIDRSGSMTGRKLELAVAATRQALRALDEGDRFAVVTFDTNVDVVVAARAATKTAVSEAEAHLTAVTAGGDTNLSGGWLTACGEIGAAGADNVARCIVLTDGQANQGITDAATLGQHARELRRRRVTTSTLGLGAGFNEFLLGRLAEEGGGNFHFAEDETALAGILSQEIGAVLSVVARDVTVAVRVPDGVVVESLNNFACSQDGEGRFVFSVGALSSGQSVAAAFRVQIPAGSNDVAIDVDASGHAHSVTYARADDEGVIDRDVVRIAARFDAAVARRVALELNQGGKHAEAGVVIDTAVAHLRALAALFVGGDAEVTAVADTLAGERDRYASPMSSLGSKQAYLSAMRTQKGQRAPSSVSLSSPPASSSSAAPPVVVPRPLASVPPRGLRVVATTTWLASAAREAVATLEPLPGLPRVEVVDVSARAYGRVLDKTNEAALVSAVSTTTPAAGSVTIVFVDASLHDNWFSHWHADSRVAVVSVLDFAPMTALPLSSFIAYEVLFHGLRTQSDGYDPLTLAHKADRGCLFDLCLDKAEIAVKLQAGHVCAECVRRLTALHVDAPRVQRMWSAVQGLAHP